MRTRRSISTADALADERRDAVERVPDEVVGPGQEHGRLGGEEIDDGLGDVGQAGTPLLGADVGRHAPERLFADRPDAVEDVVDEPALPFDRLGDDRFGQSHAAAEGDGLVAGPVPVADEIEEDRGLGGRPIGAETLLGQADMGRPDGLGDLGPSRGVAGLRIGMPGPRAREGRRRGPPA